MASGVLPFEFFKKAKSFHDKIAANSSIDLQISDVDGGTVAAVLDLASQEKVSKCYYKLCYKCSFFLTIVDLNKLSRFREIHQTKKVNILSKGISR